MVGATFFNDKKMKQPHSATVSFFAFAYSSNISILNLDGALSW